MCFCEIKILARDHINKIAYGSVQILKDFEFICGGWKISKDNFFSIQIIIDDLT